MRIALLSYRSKPHCGGQGVYIRHLSRELVALGHSVEVFGGQPYPILDPRVPLHKLPSLDIFNDQYPGRLPAYWELKTKEDVLETAQYLTGTFSEPLAFSARAYKELKRRTHDFDLVHDNQSLGYGLLRLFMNVVFWVVCLIPGLLNYLWPLWDPKSQTWSDKIASSVVVKTQ